MAVIYFLRHGETDYNAAHRIQGTADVPINANGRAQAQRNGEALARRLGGRTDLDFVASPLLRTRQTMEAVRQAMGLTAQGYRTDPLLLEVGFGDWAGMTWAEVEERDAENFARYSADPWNTAMPGPGGESYSSLYARTMAWLAGVKTDTVAVSHGGGIRCLCGHFLKLAPAELLKLGRPQDQVLAIDGGQVSWV